MQAEIITNGWNRNAAKIWIGVALGTAVGVGIVLSRRTRKTRWDTARDITKRMASRSGEFAEVSRELVDRVKTIYEESRKVVEDATELWARSRKLVGV